METTKICYLFILCIIVSLQAATGMKNKKFENRSILKKTQIFQTSLPATLRRNSLTYGV